ncbi:ArsB/NhaD family transporter [Dactylosporangium sp. AC04546]|uniref:SLC13 family permease n=1 Tax=Dactylosporangium sp. AC04546 TaxID=2862460 RepID=UPI001EDD1CE3|nr:SLC13 family permease [Dactylosporangium sp. AC04546]WVK81328.1 ArsB/NhaD family transporter [Dactylosporangium sp. AC04546]
MNDSVTVEQRPARAARWRPDALTWVAIAVSVLGVAAVLAGPLTPADATATLRRVLPLLIFLGFVVILAELTAKAEVFDVVAARLAILGRGHYAVLFLLCVLLASATTMFLNLDTTAVLLTPVMLAVARAMRVPPLPLAMTTVWLANTASLLLPVSNLTNLLAGDRIDLTPAEFAARTLLPQAASILATMACLWLFYWRRGRRGAERYTPPAPHRPHDRVLFVLASVACVSFVVLILVGVPLAWTTGACAGAVLAGFLLRDRASLRWSLIPVRLLCFVTGLFLVMQAVGRLGLDDLLTTIMSTDPGVAGTVRAAATGAGLSNLINNLPAYVAGESAVPVANHTQLLGLLLGTNIGPIIVPWASLATLLWYERCRAQNVTVNWSTFIRTGAVTAVVTLGASVAVLLLIG